MPEGDQKLYSWEPGKGKLQAFRKTCVALGLVDGEHAEEKAVDDKNVKREQLAIIKKHKTAFPHLFN